ncbi:DUF4878 domain-containing protein [Aureispira]|nr:DUF4878 domain-containing protein [Aureispira sp.]
MIILRLFTILTFLLFSMICFGQDLNTPESTFNSLIKVIQDKDLEGYKKIWHEDSLEREGMYSKLHNDDALWERLQRIFIGPQKMKDGEYYDNKYTVTIDAPKAGKNGIGAITLIKIGEEWKMYYW